MSFLGFGKALIGGLVKPVARTAKATVEVITMDYRAPASLERIYTGSVEDVKKLGKELEEIFEDE